MKTAMIRNIERLLAGFFLVLVCSASYGFRIDGFEYKILSEEDQTAELSQYNYSDNAIFEMPAEITYDDKTYTITQIGENAFKDCTALEYVEFPISLKVIGSGAFKGCKALKSISFPSSLETIEEGAFYSCEELKRVTFSDGLKRLGGSAFYNCSSLTEVKLPDSILEYGNAIFDFCTSLEKLELPESMEFIPGSFLSNCKNLHSIKIPSSIKKIGAFAFSYSGITSIELPETLESIESSAFSGCNFTTFKIPDSLESIGGAVFMDCHDLSTFIISENNPNFSTESGILYNKDKTILYEWPSVKGFVDIPSGVKEIWKEGFQANGYIEYIRLPETVTYIGEMAFIDCVNVKAMYCMSPIPPEAGSGALWFRVMSGWKDYKGKVYVPSASMDLYKTTPEWDVLKDFMYPLEDAEVEMIPAAPSTDSYTVYTIDGRFMMQTRNIEELQNLPKGLYIVNGKKHLVK